MTKKATCSGRFLIQPTLEGSTDHLPYSESGDKVRQQVNKRFRKEYNLEEDCMT
jgi:hypothetical protein